MKKQKKHTGRRYLTNAVLVLCLLVFLFSLGKLVSVMGEYRQAQETYKAAEEDFTEKNTGTDKNEGEESKLPQVDFDKLKAVNEDIIGWIYIEGIDVSYPILKGESNQEYLFSSYEKKYLVAGSIFADYRCSGDFREEHTVIYGHNMHDGSMFGRLDKYADEKFRKDNPDVYIILPDRVLGYKITEAKKVSIKDEIYKLPAPDAEGEVEVGEQLILSTCTEDSSDEYRFILVCKINHSEHCA